MSTSPRVASAGKLAPPLDVDFPDDISLNSTIDSQHDSDQDFDIERVQGEEVDPEDPTRRSYLIQWTGYNMDRWTWEPAHHLKPEAIAEWEESKARHARGEEVPFDIALWDEAVLAAEDRKRERHRRRNFRRKREGLPLNLHHGEAEWEYALGNDSDGEDDFNSILPRPKPVPASNKSPVASSPTRRDKRLPQTKTQAKKAEAAPRDEQLHPSLPARPPPKAKPTTTGYQGTAWKSSASLPDKPHTVDNRMKPVADKDTPSAPLHKAKKSNPKARSVAGNVFISGKKPHVRRNLGDAMVDKTKDARQFSSMRILNKAGKYSRQMADRPPADPTQLGLLKLSNIGDAARTNLRADSDNAAASSMIPTSPTESIKKTAEPIKSALRKSRDSLFTDGQDQPLAKKARSVRFTADETTTEDPSLVTTRIMEDVELVDEPGPIVVEGDEDDDELFVSNVPVAPSITPSLPPRPSAASTPGLNLQILPQRPTQSITSVVVFGPSDCQRAMLSFEGLPMEPGPWQSRLLSGVPLTFTHICTAYAFEKGYQSCIETVFVTGFVMSKTNFNGLEIAAEQLKEGSFALTCHDADFSILMYPAKCEKWKTVFPVADATSPATISLRYVIFKAAGKAGQFMLPPTGDLQLPPGPAAANFVRQVFGIDYNKLLPVDLRKNTGRHSFFLAFPPSRGSVMNMMCTWLRYFNPCCRLFVSGISGDWNAFVESVQTECGMVILHGKALPTVRFFPGIQKLLQAESTRFSFWRFEEKLQRQRLKPSIGQSIGGHAPFDFSRLFPHGDAIFLTPSFLLTQPLRARQLLLWYKSEIRRSAAFTQLVASAGIVKFLEDVAVEKARKRNKILTGPGPSKRPPTELGLGSEDCGIRFEIWQLVSELVGMSKFRLSYEGAEAFIFADESIHSCDEQSLVNWFGYWSGANLHRYRNFRVLGSCENGNKQATLFVDLPTFVPGSSGDPDQTRASNIPDPEMMDHETKMLGKDSASSFRTFLQDETIQKGHNHPVKVYFHPVSYLQSPSEMAQHFGDPHMDFVTATAWFKWMRSFMSPLNRRGFNSHLCFFYTIKGDWNPAEYPEGVFPPRHPWIVIYRPTNPYRQPYKSTELIIWDPSASEMCSGPTDAPESQLLPAQRALIRLVEELGPSTHNGLKLERIWLGGFYQPSAAHVSVIDRTMEMIQHMVSDFRQWLPATEYALPQKGFRLVQRGERMPASAATQSNPPATPNIVFHPPSTPFPNQGGSRCMNTFFQDVALASQTKVSDHRILFTFAPTLKWYAQQQEEGRHFEHVQVDRWEPIFKSLGVSDETNNPGNQASASTPSASSVA